MIYINWVNCKILNGWYAIKCYLFSGLYHQLSLQSLRLSNTLLLLLITLVASILWSYFFWWRIVQGADWHYGPAKRMNMDETPSYIKYSAIVTSFICFILFFAYLIYLVCSLFSILIIRAKKVLSFKMFFRLYTMLHQTGKMKSGDRKGR